MKKIITLILLIASVSAVSGQKVKWLTFEEAVALNETNPKKILIDVYTDWCGWCKVMDKNTFSDPIISKYINDNFYAVKFDAESSSPITFRGHTFSNNGSGTRSTHELAVALLNGKMSYPSIAYMDETNQLITAIPGYYDPKKIEPLLSFIANDIYKTNQTYQDYQTSFVSKLSTAQTSTP
jgi:thioredoxin-related protein